MRTLSFRSVHPNNHKLSAVFCYSPGSRVLTTGSQIHNPRSKNQDPGYWVPHPGSTSWASSILDPGSCIQDLGIQDDGSKISATGCRIRDPGSRRNNPDYHLLFKIPTCYGRGTLHPFYLNIIRIIWGSCGFVFLLRYPGRTPQKRHQTHFA